MLVPGAAIEREIDKSLSLATSLPAPALQSLPSLHTLLSDCLPYLRGLVNPPPVLEAYVFPMFDLRRCICAGRPPHSRVVLRRDCIYSRQTCGWHWLRVQSSLSVSFECACSRPCPLCPHAPSLHLTPRLQVHELPSRKSPPCVRVIGQDR